MYKISPKPIALLRAASTGAALAAICLLLPGCVFDTSGVSRITARFKCTGTIKLYGRANDPTPPTTWVQKNAGDATSKGWAPFDLSKPNNKLRFYTNKDWRPTSPHPLLKGSFLLQLASGDRMDSSPDNSDPDNFLRLNLVGQNVDRFWIGFDERATTTPQWLRDNYKKWMPERFIVSSQEYSVSRSPWGGKTKPVRYQLWVPKVSPTTLVGSYIYLGGNNAQGVVWKEQNVGSQYVVIIRIRPTPDLNSFKRKLATITVEVEADTKALIQSNPSALEQGKAEAMEKWLLDLDNRKYDQSYRDGLVRVETDVSKCNQRCTMSGGVWYCKKCPAVGGTGGTGGTGSICQPINGWAHSSQANISAYLSQATVEVVGHGSPKSTSLTGGLDFHLDRNSNVEIAGFDLFAQAVTLSDNTYVSELTIGQNATITALCADELPPGPFRLCERYVIPAGDKPGFEAGAAAKVDGQDVGVTLVNSQPIDLLVDFNQMRYHMSGGPLEGTFRANGQDLHVKISINLIGDFTNLAPVPHAAETQLEWECGDGSQAVVTLSADGSLDELNPYDIVGYSWAEDAGSLTDTILGTSKNLTVPMSFGQHDITLFVTDSHGITSHTSLVVEVVDSQIDNIELPPDRWEMQHDRSGAPVSIGEAWADDNCSGMVDISNNEPVGGWFPPGFSTVEWQFDDFRGNLVIHHQKIFVLEQPFFPAPISATQTTLGQIQVGQTQQITHNLTSQGKGMIADEYILIYAPDGSLYSIDPAGAITSGPQPRSTFTTFGAAGTSTVAYSGVFSDEFQDEGEYTVESSLVVAGGDPADPADVIARSWSIFNLAP